MFNVPALLLDDALKPATPLTNGTINENQLIFDEVQSISIFIIKCDKRTQNSAEFSENDSAENIRHTKICPVFRPPAP